MKVHKHPSGLFGVGLLVEVSIEVAQLRTRDHFKYHICEMYHLLVCETSTERFLTRLEACRSYHRSGIKLRYDVVEEGCEVGGAGLELLNAVKAVTLAICLKQRR